MYIISQDSHFVMGMGLLLKAINPCPRIRNKPYSQNDSGCLVQRRYNVPGDSVGTFRNVFTPEGAIRNHRH